MVSFDVVSLFTSIPQDLALATVKDLLSRRGLGQHQDSLRPEDLVDLLGLCLKTYFTFQGNTYEQIKGTPMGSPISSVIAEAVLQWIEQVAMAQYCPKFWARYVDDTFVVIKKSRKADFVGVLNSVCMDLQFTEEEEHQGRLAFLDVLVHRQPDGTLATRVYRKPTHTDRILHFNSNHPVSHKVSCIRTLFKRADSHCSTAKAKAEERKYLFHTCRRNGYPNKFIRRHSALPRPPHNPPIGELLPQTTRITLPYVSNVSEATARLLSPYGIRVAHRPDRTLRSCIMRLKDPLPVTEKSGVIYRIYCMDCPGNYVGETSKRVRTRIQEHKLAIKRGEHYSQIFTHMAELGHKFDFNGVQVIASDASKSGRLLKEAWFSDCKSINRCVELHPAHQVMKAWEARIGSRRRRHPIVCNPDCSNKETDNEMRAILPSRVPPAISGSCAHLLMNEESLDNSNPPPGILDAPNISPLPPPPPRYGVRPIERYRALLPPTLEVKQNSPPRGDFDACVPDDPLIISDLDACLKIGTPGVDDDYNRTTKGPITRSRTAWWTREGARAKTAVGISSEGRVESDAKLTGTEIATNCCTSHACKGGGLGAIGEDGSTNEVVCPRRVMRQTRGREIVGSRISSQDRSAVTQVTLVRSDMEYSHPSLGAARNREVISCRNLELRNTSDISDGRINRPGPITRSMSRVQARLGL